MANDSNPFEFNPYAPTAYAADEPVVPEDVEQFRQHYLSHEASVQSIGVLYILGAVLLVPMGVLIATGTLGNGNQVGNQKAIMAAIGVFYVCLGLFHGIVGYGLRKLSGWTRIAASILSVFGLIGFPIGTLISGYFLYLLLSEKGRVVFSEPYQQVIAQTPHIKYKTSIVVWIFLGLLVTLIAIGLIAAFARTA